MKTNDKKIKSISPKFAVISRIDYGSEGFRKGLLDATAAICEAEDVGFVVLAGGLVSRKALKEHKLIPKDREELKRFIKNAASDLSHKLPHMYRKDGSLIKYYFILSPAYDGDIGEIIAQRLAGLRKDVMVWNSGEDRILIKGQNSGQDRWVTILTPLKAAWLRGDYYSTPVQRVLSDFAKRTSQLKSSINIVGCFGVSLNKPEGEVPLSYIAAPVLHKLRETTVSENQVGLVIVDVSHESGYQATFHSFKDFLSHERTLVPLPDDMDPLQKMILGEIAANGGLTVGMISHNLKISREKIRAALKPLLCNKNGIPQNGWPVGVCYNSGSRKYDFNLKWIQNNLTYDVSKWTKNEGIQEDRILAFGCLHAGSRATDYWFFTKVLPRYIIDEKVTTLIGAGDFVEGLKHELMLRQEILGSLNYTDQEELAGMVVGDVIVEVFKNRFEENLGVKNSTLSDAISNSLLNFVFIPGNHCSWVEGDGHRPLSTFEAKLHNRISDGIQEILAQKKCPAVNLRLLIEPKIIRHESFDDRYITPNGKLSLAIVHPYMSRTKTSSIRAQEALGKFPDANIVVSANFHTSIYLQQHTAEIGERQSLQVGTIKSHSAFEDHKLKTVDFGVGLLVVQSQNGRIISAANEFFGPPSGKTLKDLSEYYEFVLKRSGLSF